MFDGILGQFLSYEMIRDTKGFSSSMTFPRCVAQVRDKRTSYLDRVHVYLTTNGPLPFTLALIILRLSKSS